jgi:hypothetical protein
MDDAKDGCFFHSHNRGQLYRCCGANPQLLRSQAAFTEKIALPENSDDRLVAALRDDRHLYIAGLDVEHGIGSISLRKYELFVLVIPTGASFAFPVEKYTVIKHKRAFARHWKLLKR